MITCLFPASVHALITQRTCERFGAPGYVDGVADGGEGRHRAVGSRVPERDGQRAVAAHGVAADGGAAYIELPMMREAVLEQQVGEKSVG